MQKVSKEEFIKKYSEAPEEIQNLMGSDETIDTIQSIKSSQSLTSEQTSQLASNIGYVLVGLLHPKDFVATIQKTLSVSTEIATEIAREVNQQIFSHVKDLLIETYSLGGGESSKPKEAPPASPDLFEKKLKQSVLAARTPQSTKIPVTKEGEEKRVEPPAPQKDSYREPIE